MSERQHWDEYQNAYQEALAQTSKPWAPWYAIPADNKRHARLEVAKLVLHHLKSLPLQWPEASAEDQQAVQESRRGLANGEL